MRATTKISIQEEEEIRNANYLQEMLKDISFIQQIFTRVHDVTLAARKIAVNETDKNKTTRPSLMEFTFSSRKTDNTQVKKK